MAALPVARPGRSSVAVVDAAAKALLPSLAEWCGSQSPEADVLRDITAALRSEGYRGAYQIARHLDDRCYWYPDDDLLNRLEAADTALAQAHRDAVRSWVSANRIVVPFEVGQTVQTRHGLGSVVRIDEAEATILVAIPAMAAGRSGYLGTIFAFEDCSAHAEAA